MRTTVRLNLLTLALALALGPWLAAQVQTEVPPVVPGAKPVTVERIKVHGNALEGNLEGNAVNRDVIVFLPPSYAEEKSRRYPYRHEARGCVWKPVHHEPLLPGAPGIRTR